MAVTAEIFILWFILFILWFAETVMSVGKNISSGLQLLGLVFWLRLRGPFVSQSPIRVYASFSWRDSGLCIYQWVLLIACTVPKRSPTPYHPCILTGLISWICWLCGLLSHLYLHTFYIFYSGFYLFLPIYY